MLSAIILACTLSIDAFGIGFVYGVKNITVPASSRLIIYLISFSFALTASVLGGKISSVLPPAYNHIIGFAMLFFPGAYICFSDFKSNNQSIKNPSKGRQKNNILNLGLDILHNTTKGDRNNSKNIETAEAVYIGIALSTDSLGTGIAYGINDGQIWLFAFAIGIFQIIMLSCGTFIGGKTNRLPIKERVFSLIPGIILMIISVLRLFDIV